MKYNHLSGSYDINSSSAPSVYFIEYDYVGHKHYCIIEAYSKNEASDIFKRKFNYGNKINKMQTTNDIANKVSDKLIEVIQSQMNSIPHENNQK
jgi:hypothetical protein